MRAPRPAIAAALAATSLSLGGFAALQQLHQPPAAVAPTSAAAIVTTGPAVVVIGAPDLLWGAVTATGTPALWSALPDAAAGAMSVKATDPVSCLGDGWLTLGAGNRTTALDRRGTTCPASAVPVVQQVGAGAQVPAIPSLAAHNRHLDDGAEVGALAAAVDGVGSCVAAAGPGAAIAAADPAGHVDRYLPDSATAAADAAFLGSCPVTLITGTAADAGELMSLVRANRPDAVVMIVGLADVEEPTAHLQVAMADGPGFATEQLVSASTRRSPFVQLVDVAPTILAERGIPPVSSMIGESWRPTGPPRSGSHNSTASRVAALADLDRAAQRQGGAIVPFFVALVVFMMLVSGIGWLLARRRDPVAARNTGATGLLCVASALVPAASFTANLVPWWRATHPLLALAAATVAGVAIGSAVVWLLDRLVWGRRRIGAAGGVGAVTAAVIGVDLLSGAHLQMFSMAGYSPLVAGRFAGIGNVAFGIFAAGALLAAAAVAALMATPARAAAATAGIGLLAVAVDGGPWWGSDVGGILSLVPTLVLLAGWVSAVRISWFRAIAAIVGAAMVVGVLGALDYARPANQQTHLGRFVGKALHGGAWTVLRRKGLADVHLLTHSPLTLLIPLLVIAGIIVICRPRGLLARAFDDEPVLRAALTAVLVMSLIGAALNDSGVVIPALAVLVALPATVATVLRASRPASAGSASGGEC